MLDKAAEVARERFFATIQERFGRDIRVTLRPDEVPVWQEPVDVFYTTNTVFARIKAIIASVIALATGLRTNGVAICTNRRVVLVTQQFFLWVLQIGANYQTIYCDQLSGVDVGSESPIPFFPIWKKKVMHLYAAGREPVSLAFSNISERDLFDRMGRLTDAKFGAA